MEIWKDVPDWEGTYQVSSLGRVRSITRTVTGSDGRKWRVQGRMRRLQHTQRQLTFTACDGERDFRLAVARCVLFAFSGIPGPMEIEAHYKDKDYRNCSLENLYWATGEALSRFQGFSGRVSQKGLDAQRARGFPALVQGRETHKKAGYPGLVKGRAVRAARRLEQLA